ncbi:hypothetical protein QTP86_019574 [Hemibagrus guttatus]|nr:hypothetical protein QTP86_019574 [Hemibagrus guttatus]
MTSDKSRCLRGAEDLFRRPRGRAESPACPHAMWPGTSE